MASVREFWPDTATEALETWDRGTPLWSQRLTALHLGPWREHAMQIAVFETLRRCLATVPPGTIATRTAVNLAFDQTVRETSALASDVDLAAAVAARDLARRALNDGWAVTVGRLVTDRRILVRSTVAIAPRPW